jgi:hypothetical protein
MNPKVNKHESFRRELPVIVLATLALAATFIWFSGWVVTTGVDSNVAKSGVAQALTESDASASADAFLRAYTVFMHPRCVNCHPAGDQPLVGNEQIRPHAMDVKRGPDGMGKNGLWCSTCHQNENLTGDHMPPGAPGWELPPEDMPMVFEKVSPRELCEHFKDPTQNGGRNPQEVVEHVQTAPLVLWGWNPGESRTPVLMPHQEFVKNMAEWAKKGATCPK